MASLASAGNVHATCLRILRARGYTLACDAGDYEDAEASFGFLAHKNGFSFAAEDPLALLGLTAIYEHVQPERDEPYWWAVKGPDIQDELAHGALERALGELRERDPQRYRAVVLEALAAADSHVTAAERLGISEAELQRIRKDPLLT